MLIIGVAVVVVAAAVDVVAVVVAAAVGVVVAVVVDALVVVVIMSRSLFVSVIGRCCHCCYC